MTGGPARFFEQPDLYLARNPTLETRRRLVRELMPHPAPRRVLDVGCGDGSLSLPLLPGFDHLTLLDASAPMLERARALLPRGAESRVTLVQSDLFDFRPGDGFDLVLVMGVLAHVISVPDAVRLLAGLVRPGGWCLIQITDVGRLPGRLFHRYDRRRRSQGHSGGHATNRTRASEILSCARDGGLTLDAVRNYLPTLPGMGRLPGSWGTFAARHVLASRSIAFLGSETILRFRRS